MRLTPNREAMLRTWWIPHGEGPMLELFREIDALRADALILACETSDQIMKIDLENQRLKEENEILKKQINRKI